MKHINNFINEKLVINKNTKIDKYHYHPKNKDELQNLIKQLIKKRGNEANLNDIDTSEITDMSLLFNGLQKFNGDISEWDVGNVKDMTSMFNHSKFNGDISKWDVSNVRNMNYMFLKSEFTGERGDISNWDVSYVEDMGYMFFLSKFNGDLSKWDISNVTNMNDMFYGCPLEKNPPKWYK